MIAKLILIAVLLITSFNFVIVVATYRSKEKMYKASDRFSKKNRVNKILGARFELVKKEVITLILCIVYLVTYYLITNN